MILWRPVDAIPLNRAVFGEPCGMVGGARETLGVLTQRGPSRVFGDPRTEAPCRLEGVD